MCKQGTHTLQINTHFCQKNKMQTRWNISMMGEHSTKVWRMTGCIFTRTGVIYLQQRSPLCIIEVLFLKVWGLCWENTLNFQNWMFFKTLILCNVGNNNLANRDTWGQSNINTTSTHWHTTSILQHWAVIQCSQHKKTNHMLLLHSKFHTKNVVLMQLLG